MLRASGGASVFVGFEEARLIGLVRKELCELREWLSEPERRCSCASRPALRSDWLVTFGNGWFVLFFSFFLKAIELWIEIDVDETLL